MKIIGKKFTLSPLRVLGIGVLSICAALTLLGVIFAFRCGTALSESAYEVAEKYVIDLDRSELLSLSKEFLSGRLSEYEDGSNVDSSLEALLLSGELTVSRADGYKASSPKFSVYVDGRYCFELTVKHKLVTLGGTEWKIGGLSVPEDTEIAPALTLHVPKGATVSVNGSEILRSEANPVPYFALSRLESSLSEEFYSESYELGRFLTLPDVVVTLDGKRLSADTVENGTIRYAYPSSYVSNYTVTVPYGSSVKVNGTDLDRTYLVDPSTPYPFLTRFEEGFTGLPTAVVYQLSGLFSKPDVVVTYGGQTLSDGGGYSFLLPEEMTDKIVVLAPDYATVKLNGMTLSAAELTGSRIELPILDGVTSHAKTRPYLNEYTVDGLLRDGTLAAYDKNGKPLEISTYYSTPEKIVFCCTRSNAMPDREKLTLRTFGREYVEYVYNGNNNLAANYKDITAMTPGSSSAYYALHALYKTLYNAPKYKNISVGTVEFIEYYPYTSTSMSVIMKVPFTATLNGVKYKFTVTMDVLYIYSGEIRRIVNYKILDTVSSQV